MAVIGLSVESVFRVSSFECSNRSLFGSDAKAYKDMLFYEVENRLCHILS